jgi:hypothetical protein
MLSISVKFSVLLVTVRKNILGNEMNQSNVHETANIVKLLKCHLHKLRALESKL